MIFIILVAAGLAGAACFDGECTYMPEECKLIFKCENGQWRIRSEVTTSLKEADLIAAWFTRIFVSAMLMLVAVLMIWYLSGVCGMMRRTRWRAAIKQVPQTEALSEEQCGVCYTLFDWKTCVPVRAYACIHVCCASCVAQWSAANRAALRCPVCRSF